jgi:hypothetical protein
VSQICGTLKKSLVITWKLDPKAKSVGHFSPEPASLVNRGPHVRAAWSASGDDGGNYRSGAQRAITVLGAYGATRPLHQSIYNLKMAE